MSAYLSLAVVNRLLYFISNSMSFSDLKKRIRFLENKTGILGTSLTEKYGENNIREYINNLYTLFLRASILERAYCFNADRVYHYRMLSRRELEICEYIIAGYKPAGIADILCISVLTVERHIANIYIKLDVINRKQMLNLSRKKI